MDQEESTEERGCKIEKKTEQSEDMSTERLRKINF